MVPYRLNMRLAGRGVRAWPRDRDGVRNDEQFQRAIKEIMASGSMDCEMCGGCFGCAGSYVADLAFFRIGQPDICNTSD